MIEVEKCPYCGSDAIMKKCYSGVVYCRSCRRILQPKEFEGVDVHLLEFPEELEGEICKLRKMCFGLSACEGCPIACAIQSDNLNKLENYKWLLGKMEELYKRFFWRQRR